MVTGSVTGCAVGNVWQRWADRWESFQSAYVPGREEQFGTVTSYLRQWCRPAPRLLDLCCGPGSMGKRVLAQIPNSTTVGVDADPWLLEIARRTSDPRRAGWVYADLRAPGWSATRGLTGGFDAVTLTTASHWFDDDVLAELYVQAAGLLVHGGPLVVVDLIPDVADAHGPARLPLARVLTAQSTASRASETWPEFWAAAACEPTFAGLLAERNRLLPPRRAGRFRCLEDHAAALRAAGLGTVTQLWRRDASAVIAAFT